MPDNLTADPPEFDASDPDFDGQDMAEAWDEDNQDSDSQRIALGDDELNADDRPDVYDATTRVGDEDDDDALIGDDMEDADIVELVAGDDEDDEDGEDDSDRLRSADAFGEADETDLADDDDTDPDAAAARLSPDEVELEDAGDLNDRQGAFGSARRFESSRLSDADIEELGYSPKEPRSFDPSRDRTDEENAVHAHQDALLDQGVEETFPASDPVSVKHIT
jgi:hypothetical protein